MTQEQAQQLTGALIAAVCDLGIPIAMPSTWAMGVRCVQEGDVVTGYRLLLYAFRCSPEAPQIFLAALDRRLSGVTVE